MKPLLPPFASSALSWRSLASSAANEFCASTCSSASWVSPGFSAPFPSPGEDNAECVSFGLGDLGPKSDHRRAAEAVGVADDVECERCTPAGLDVMTGDGAGAGS